MRLNVDLNGKDKEKLLLIAGELGVSVDSYARAILVVSLRAEVSTHRLAKDLLANSSEDSSEISTYGDTITWDSAARAIAYNAEAQRKDDPRARAFIRENLTGDDGRLIEYQAVRAMGAGG